MLEVDVHDAETQLSRLISVVERGGQIVVTRYGKPVAKLVPIEIEPSQLRPVGFVAGEVSDEAFGPLSEEELQRWQ